MDQWDTNDIGNTLFKPAQQVGQSGERVRMSFEDIFGIKERHLLIGLELARHIYLFGQRFVWPSARRNNFTQSLNFCRA